MNKSVLIVWVLLAVLAISVSIIPLAFAGGSCSCTSRCNPIRTRSGDPACNPTFTIVDNCEPKPYYRCVPGAASGFRDDCVCVLTTCIPEAMECSDNSECCSNNCNNNHCCPNGYIWNGINCQEYTQSCKFCQDYWTPTITSGDYWDCVGTNDRRCGKDATNPANPAAGMIVEGERDDCDVNNDYHYRCIGTDWYSCYEIRSPTPWVTYNLASGETTPDERCCDGSLWGIGAPMWSYCGDENCNLVCGENQINCLGDCGYLCSSEVCSLMTGDEDCDGDCNYDSSSCSHGDNDCPVSITSAPEISNLNPCLGETITVGCTASVPNINSVLTMIDSTKCSFIGWNGNKASFACTTKLTPGSQTISCAIDNTKSYQQGLNTTQQVLVGGANCCGQHLSAQECENDNVCDWCNQCSATKYSGGQSRCVAAGSCTYYCDRNPLDLVLPYDYCNAICDLTDALCPECTTPLGYNGRGNCTATCSCQGCIATEWCGDGLVNGNEECEGSSCKPNETGKICNPSTCKYEAAIPEANCTDNIDNDCDTVIDGKDNNTCKEGQGVLGSNNRGCDDGVDNDADILVDVDDDGCCDRCISMGLHFDTTDRSTCGTPDCNCGTEKFEWENTAQQQQYCCGDDAFEFYKTNPVNPSVAGCCNDSSRCVDEKGNCQIGTEELFGLCTNSQDDDCDGKIDINDTNCTGMLTGIIYKEGLQPLAGAIVKGSLPGTPYESQAITGPDGRYTIPNALVGEYPFIASKVGYDDNVTIINIISKATATKDFTLRNGSCHYDCTDYYGNCNPACQGLDFGAGETCTFISTICYNRPKGFIATYKDADQKITHEYACCEGPERTYSTIQAKVTGNIENVYDYKFTVLVGGQRRTLHVLYWNK